MNSLNNLAKEIHEASKARGFDVAYENLGQTLMLVVAELAEALEADRIDRRSMLRVFKQDLKYAGLEIADFEPSNRNHDWIKNRFETTVKDTFEDEIADSLMRLLDLCGALNIDIETFMELKMRYNVTRPYKHGKKY